MGLVDIGEQTGRYRYEKKHMRMGPMRKLKADRSLRYAEMVLLYLSAPVCLSGQSSKTGVGHISRTDVTPHGGV